MDTIRELNEIFEKHSNERICVIGTTCCGKTTLLKKIPSCIDMDDALFSRLTKKEAEFLCQMPWTKEIGNEFDRLVYEKVQITPGFPMFGTVILECEVAVYLDIEDELLKIHCDKRNATFEDAINMKAEIDKDWSNHKEKQGITFYRISLTE